MRSWFYWYNWLLGRLVAPTLWVVSVRNGDAVPVVEFRQECREFAAGWVDIQRDEFKRLGITGKWENPYLTMDFHAERVIAAEFQKFLMNGTLYQGSKPVMWSPVEKTALAEAEVEYHDKESFTVWVKFQVVGTGDATLDSAKVVQCNQHCSIPGRPRSRKRHCTACFRQKGGTSSK